MTSTRLLSTTAASVATRCFWTATDWGSRLSSPSGLAGSSRSPLPSAHPLIGPAYSGPPACTAASVGASDFSASSSFAFCSAGGSLSAAAIRSRARRYTARACVSWASMVISSPTGVGFFIPAVVVARWSNVPMLASTSSAMVMASL